MSKFLDKKAIECYERLIKIILDQNHVNPFETKEEQQERIDKCKKSFKLFVENCFKHYAEAPVPDFHIDIANKVKHNKQIKAWLRWARGHAKSVVANVLLPLWLWINDEIDFFLLIGQNEDKAQMLLSDIQAEFEVNPLLIHDYGSQKTSGSWEHGYFKCANGFIGKSLGMGQDPRGIRVGSRRPDYITADDWETRETVKNPARQDEYAKWLLTAVIPAMGHKNKRVLICQNDFAPRIIFKKIVTENPSWIVHTVNAYNPVTYEPTWKGKYTPEYWKQEEKDIGVLNAQAEYNNAPHVEGKIFTDKHIQWCVLPRLNQFDHILGIWDVAYAGTATSDYNAVRVWGIKDDKKYLIDCFVMQTKLNEALEWIAYFQMALPKTVSVQFKFESQFWNDEVYRIISETEIKHKIKLNLIKLERSTKKKYERILEMLPAYQNGRVFYNIGLKAHNSTKIGIQQLFGIEPGYKTKDDAPDADKYAFDELDTYSRTSNFNHSTVQRTTQKY
jgi:phage terminase large subunit-like protein